MHRTCTRFNLVKWLEQTYLWLWVFLHIWGCSITPRWELPSYLSCPDDHKRGKTINVSDNVQIRGKSPSISQININWSYWLKKNALNIFSFITFDIYAIVGDCNSHEVACIWPLTWRAGSHEEGATWFGGPWFSVSAGAFSAASSPSGLWGLRISPPFLCKDYKRNIVLIKQHRMAVQVSGGQRRKKEKMI